MPFFGKRKLLFLMTIFLTGKVFSIPLNKTTPIDCVDFGLQTPLAGNPVAIQILLDICVSSNRCARLFGQNYGEKLDLFAGLLEKTTEFSPPLFLETPINNYVCSSSSTLQEINAILWLLRIERDYLDSELMCGLDEEPLLNPDTQEITCRPCPGCSIQNDINTNPLILVFGSTFLIVLLIYGAAAIWKLAIEERKYKLRLQGFDQTTGITM
jgi:hypothetical protein